VPVQKRITAGVRLVPLIISGSSLTTSLCRRKVCELVRILRLVGMIDLKYQPCHVVSLGMSCAQFSTANDSTTRFAINTPEGEAEAELLCHHLCLISETLNLLRDFWGWKGNSYVTRYSTPDRSIMDPRHFDTLIVP